ncbi:hypothetical protein BACCOPRO_00188 [Phocaeicola coprophilus DSM 18228 = JCM 13818]|uniref:Uncharacterized protein n=1 Tax=Phocaeicola coprophilus DSM 18228 = JCM 13818 TaxID=547042 RepID=S0F4L1_9BACT|nr:hypothetical protein BACCOPRO_00188 [Phocaeicola coprophilus DSM 18228 = JCM 13818]
MSAGAFMVFIASDRKSGYKSRRNYHQMSNNTYFIPIFAKK